MHKNFRNANQKTFFFQEGRLVKKIITEEVEIESEMNFDADQDHPVITTMVRTSLQYFM